MRPPAEAPEVGLRRAFTRGDLLVSLAVVAALGLLQIRALAHAKGKSVRITCLSNLKRLAMAWQMYAQENQGELIGAANWQAGLKTIPNWAGGSWLTLSNRRDPNNWDHESFTKKSVLWPYASDTELWHCPADPSTAIDRAGTVVPRIRSYSMNSWVGGPGWSASGPWWPNGSSPESRGWRVYRKIADMGAPGPARTFVFLDEREDSLNDGYLALDMAGYPPSTQGARIIDYPADWHQRGANLTFGDGHTETWRWRDPRTMPLHSRTDRPLDVPSPGNPDVRRLQEASTRYTP